MYFYLLRLFSVKILSIACARVPLTWFRAVLKGFVHISLSLFFHLLFKCCALNRAWCNYSLCMSGCIFFLSRKYLFPHDSNSVITKYHAYSEIHMKKIV